MGAMAVSCLAGSSFFIIPFNNYRQGKATWCFMVGLRLCLLESQVSR